MVKMCATYSGKTPKMLLYTWELKTNTSKKIALQFRKDVIKSFNMLGNDPQRTGF